MSSPNLNSVAAWEYRDITAPPPLEEEEIMQVEAPRFDLFTEEEMHDRIQAALSDAQRSWESQAEERDRSREARLGSTLAAFAVERSVYFKRVEAEVVQLSLAIARKILERESILDPTLLSGLVRIALDRLGTETPVRVRVAPELAGSWRHSSATTAANTYEIVADGTLTGGDCIVETSLGTANFGVEAQLKEIERGFSDLLARRPDAQ